MGKAFWIFAAVILVFAIAALFDRTEDGSPKAGNATAPPDAPPLFPREQACAADTDCVPAECCHAAQCVSRSQEPDCAGVLCTQECQPGTLDCGQMRCGCVGGRCVTKLF